MSDLSYIAAPSKVGMYFVPVATMTRWGLAHVMCNTRHIWGWRVYPTRRVCRHANPMKRCEVQS